MLEKIVKWRKSRSERCDFTKNFARKYENQRFDKKTDRKRYELKSWKNSSLYYVIEMTADVFVCLVLKLFLTFSAFF